MSLPTLDVSTLFVVSAVVIGSSGCLLIVARGRDQNALPLVVWGTAMLVGAAGIVMLSVAPFSSWPTQIPGNVSILAGTALSWSGARLFAGRQLRPVLLCLGPTLWLLAKSTVDSGPATTVVAFLTGALYTLATASELWRLPEGRLPTQIAAVTLLFVHAAVYLMQVAATLIAPQVYLADRVIVVLMFEALLHTTWMGFLFLALMKERAELQSNQQLRALSTHDELTRLGNRRHFDSELTREFARARRDKVLLGLLMVDVDRFKAFNDTYGHQAGDESLRLVGGAIRAACSRPGDQAMRYGGEEFAVLLPRSDQEGIMTVAETVRTNVELLAIEHTRSGRGIVTVSIGAACLVPGRDVQQPEQLVRAADEALYGAKAAGRNCAIRSSDNAQPH